MCFWFVVFSSSTVLFFVCFSILFFVNFQHKIDSMLYFMWGSNILLFLARTHTQTVRCTDKAFKYLIRKTHLKRKKTLAQIIYIYINLDSGKKTRDCTCHSIDNWHSAMRNERFFSTPENNKKWNELPIRMMRMWLNTSWHAVIVRWWECECLSRCVWLLSGFFLFFFDKSMRFNAHNNDYMNEMCVWCIRPFCLISNQKICIFNA